MLDWPARKQSYEEEYDYYSRVIRWAFSHFFYLTDQEVWGVPDHWDSLKDLEKLSDENYGKINGDCDDFAQLCRHALAHGEIPTRLVLCYVEDGNYHCVAETPDGWVFDNRQTAITTWAYLTSIGYKKDRFGPLVLANSPMDEISSSGHPWYRENLEEK